MTVPHLMNCPHTDEGWCLECVVTLGNENWALQERMVTLRKAIANAKAEGWQHMTIAMLECFTGGEACAKCGLPPGCPDCRAVHDVGLGA
jgi:hypothetical protein